MASSLPRTCFLLALLLRLGSALVTEVRPIFPAYYYNDARLADETAARMAEAWKTGRPYNPAISPSQRLHAAVIAPVYVVIGRRPLAPKLLHAFIGALAALVFYFLLEPGFGTKIAFGSALLVALWPSHVFFTSQNFKDGFVLLLSYLALDRLLRCSSEPRPLSLLGAGAALLALGLFRGYVMLSLIAVLAVTLSFSLAARRLPVRPAAMALAVVLLTPALYFPLSRLVFGRLLAPPAPSAGDPTVQSSLLPRTYQPGTGNYLGVLTPRSLSETRRIRQAADRDYAAKTSGREIGTQLFAGIEFTTWGGVAAFLPKGAFYALFMPLPGLYPLGRNIGRMLASAENLALLTLALAALAGALKGKGRWSVPRLALAAFFVVMAAGSALLEFDLGSATRHRLLYMPMLFPFALSLIL